MKRDLSNLSLVFGLLLLAPLAKGQVMIVSVVEYTEFLAGGNSRMYVTYPEGKQEEIELKGLFDVGGYIRPKNLKSNDTAIAKKINELQRQGWEIRHVSMGVRPQTPNGGQESCIFTRYILTKRE